MHLHTDLDVDTTTTPSTLINITTATSATKPTTTTTTTLTELTSTTPSPLPTTALTSGTAKPLYFAYGSNLSPTQMASRCTALPSSSIPLAIARLPKWRWLIHEGGYANVVPPAEMCVSKQQAECISTGEVGVAGGPDEDAVYGVLYDMGEEDERILDGFEGVDYSAPDAAEEDMVEGMVREKEQGHGSYNKWVVEAEVVKWMNVDGNEAKTVPVLVYVDEVRVRNGPPKAEYVPRMNRAIRESVVLGLPAKWAEEVMRPAIPL
ncbi:gamma-glutamylcyclotransferase family protein, partial [Aspergillus vadensis CBS 113365]